MTDNEIIKALECCLPQNGKRNCDDCPYAECEKGCADKLTKDSLDLINHQKAEIKELRSHESRWLILAAHFGRIEELRMELFKLSNMNLEEIIEYFAKGYTLVPPEPPNFNELAKFAEEMTEETNGNKRNKDDS